MSFFYRACGAWGAHQIVHAHGYSDQERTATSCNKLSASSGQQEVDSVKEHNTIFMNEPIHLTTRAFGQDAQNLVLFTACPCQVYCATCRFGRCVLVAQ
eukprot:6380042-Amphidinium_carterae.1